MNNVIVGTAGHIDHGKSRLVEALTGTNPDRLEEERRRGITIDLGFAFLELGDVRFGLVDVPGHERFVRNMLAGVGGIDLVLLVVSADESVKPQTREHLDICRLLAIPRGIVALTKSDLVPLDRIELVRLEIEELIRGSFLEGAPIVPVSARTGAGLDRLQRELLSAAAQVPGKDSQRYLRLPIDRAFAMKGFGTVVTGTLISGAIRSEDEVELFPARKRVRVRGVQSGGRVVDRATAGQRTAVNLAGLDLEQVERGMILASPGRFQATTQFGAQVHLLPSARNLKNRRKVHFHQGTAEMTAEVVLLDRAELAAGDSALAQLRLDHPTLVLLGDRFILRQFSPVVTIGGGIVLDPLAARYRQRDVDVLPYLAALERGNHEEILGALAAEAPQGLELNRIIARTGWLEREVRGAAGQLTKAGKLRVVSEQPLVMLSAAVFTAALGRIRAAVDAFHKADPLVPGITKEELRVRTMPHARPEVFRAALDELVAKKAITISKDVVKLAGREVALEPEEARAKESIERAFQSAGLAVPKSQEVLTKLSVEPARAQKIFQLLLREQVLVRVTEDLVFHRAALAKLRDLLADHKKKKGNRLPVAVFKEMTGTSRKYAIPLLEYLDRERVTRREGEERVIL